MDVTGLRFQLTQDLGLGVYSVILQFEDDD